MAYSKPCPGFEPELLPSRGVIYCKHCRRSRRLHEAAAATVTAAPAEVDPVGMALAAMASAGRTSAVEVRAAAIEAAPSKGLSKPYDLAILAMGALDEAGLRVTRKPRRKGVK
jgi:hypothetical protein